MGNAWTGDLGNTHAAISTSSIAYFIGMTDPGYLTLSGPRTAVDYRGSGPPQRVLVDVQVSSRINFYDRTVKEFAPERIPLFSPGTTINNPNPFPLQDVPAR